MLSQCGTNFITVWVNRETIVSLNESTQKPFYLIIADWVNGKIFQKIPSRSQEMNYVILYSGPRHGTGGYKRVAEPRLFLSQLTHFKEAIAPVKKQEEQEAGHTIHCAMHCLYKQHL